MLSGMVQDRQTRWEIRKNCQFCMRNGEKLHRSSQVCQPFLCLVLWGTCCLEPCFGNHVFVVWEGRPVFSDLLVSKPSLEQPWEPPCEPSMRPTDWFVTSNSKKSAQFQTQTYVRQQTSHYYQRWDGEEFATANSLLKPHNWKRYCCHSLPKDAQPKRGITFADRRTTFWLCSSSKVPLNTVYTHHGRQPQAFTVGLVGQHLSRTTGPQAP